MISEQIIEVLNALCEKLGVAVDWSQQNVIPYVQELMSKYINYEICTSLVWMVIGFIVPLVFMLSASNIRKGAKKNNIRLCDDTEIYFWLYGICITLAILNFGAFIIIAINQIFDIVTCLTFPEKIIMEVLQNFMASTT